MNHVGGLSNEELLAQLRVHVRNGHAWQAQLIAYLVEVENRRLHVLNAYSSMWDLCLRAYGMSENEAQLRLGAARVVRKFPVALEYLQRGDIHLSGLYAISDYLTADNHEELLREASRKSVRAIEAMLAARFPRPDVPAKVESSTGPEMQPSLCVIGPEVTERAASPLVPPRPEPRPRVEPLSPARYRIELTVSAEIKERLEHIQDLMRHANPSGDLETIFGRSLLLLEREIEKRRLGKTTRPRKAKAKAPEPAETATRVPAASPASTNDDTARCHIPQSVRREVFARDGAQCTFVDAHGNRCPARTWLELDHVVPKAHGGPDTVENLRVRCRAHNAFHAEQCFGRELIERKIHSGRAKYSAAKLRNFDVAANGLRNMGFRETDVRRALATLETKPDAHAGSCETIVIEALRLLT